MTNFTCKYQKIKSQQQEKLNNENLPKNTTETN